MQVYKDELYHHGIKGMKWGVRRYQNPDGTLTAAKHAVARALTNMAAEKAYKNETRGRMYAQYTEV